MTSTSFGIDKAYFIGVWLNSCLWGALTIVYILSLLASRHRSSGRISMATLSLLYALASVHTFILFARAIQGITVEDKPKGTFLYLADSSRPLSVAAGFIYATMLFCSDLFLVWRCFMVWNRNYTVISMPFAMVVVSSISGYTAIFEILRGYSGNFIAKRFLVATVTLSLAVNILVTLLTAGRIWILSRKLETRVHTPSHVRFRFIIYILLESGTTLSIMKTVEFVLYLLSPGNPTTGLNAIYIVTNLMPQAMAMCPILISLAVSTGLTVHTTVEDPSILEFAARSTVIQSAPLPLDSR